MIPLREDLKEGVQILILYYYVQEVMMVTNSMGHNIEYYNHERGASSLIDDALASDFEI